ncbi:FUSC family protein [Corynebacterium sp.]|uniref:FUSC family protein n=1 Tax=Corynebacterium sp. TaxID=1720 RepID=UPI0026DFCBC8|nr:FUSC family protein [Corynebacterium sp.]
MGAGPRWRGGVRAAVRRVRAHAVSLLLAATAAGVAFFVAGLVVGPGDAVFAPVAAVVATGLSAGQRVQRATEISIGVVLGIVAADLLTRLIGLGPLQLALAVLLAMAAAVAVRPSGLMSNQAAVAAVVVVALVPLLDADPWVRVVDALIGGAVAVVLNAVVPVDPYRSARSAVSGVVEDYSAVLRRLGGSLRTGSLSEAEASLNDMSSLDSVRDDLGDALAATRERIILSRTTRRERRQSIRGFEAVAERGDILVATGRGLCRAGANLVRHAGETSGVTDQVRRGLARAVDELVVAVEQLPRLDTEEGADRARQLALQAATTASGQRPVTQASAVMVGQIRSAVVDVLRITGLEQAAAVACLEEAAGRADVDGW